MQEPVDGPITQLPELIADRIDDTEPDKQRKEKRLTNFSRSRDLHKIKRSIGLLGHEEHQIIRVSDGEGQISENQKRFI